ncbi:hypothetical protein N7504_002733 [Penicillium tannophilum]|nr:hypothetical protein N7504_002733 [Penicillium tannophilum]
MSAFNTFQQSGEECAAWLRYPDPDCPIKFSGLTLQNLHDEGWSSNIERIDLPQNYHFRVSEVGVSLNRVYSRFTIERFDVYGQWEGVSGPGVVIIESVVRTENSDLPYSSQLIKAVYQHEYELKTLKFIFMDNVVNEETLRFVREFIYNEETHKKLDHIQEAPQKSFEKDTPQYHQLLGTRMGKLVVYFLLNSFVPGTRHIGRVVTWFQSYRLQLRFDID